MSLLPPFFFEENATAYLFFLKDSVLASCPMSTEIQPSRTQDGTSGKVTRFIVRKTILFVM
jgi:hypothetical protein